MVWSDLTDESQDIGVVANNYRNVLHMDGVPDGAGNTFEQSDRNRFGMNFGSFGNMNSGDLVNAKVGKGIEFDGVDDLLRAKKDVIWEASSVGYISMWFRSATSGTGCLFSRRTGVGTGDSMNLFLISGTLRVDFGSASLWDTGWTAAANTWYHIAVQTDGSTRRLFVNGVQVATQSSTIGWPTGGAYHHVQIGASITSATASGNYFSGIIDEFRLKHSTQDNGFFLTEYNNQNSPSTFYSVGTLETAIVVTDRNQTGNTRIGLVTTRDQAGNTRISKIVTRDQNGNVRITRAESRLQLGNLRVRRTVNQTRIGNARIQVTSTRNQTGISRVQRQTSANQQGSMLVEKTQDRAQEGDTRIERTSVQAQLGAASIESFYIAYFQDQPGRVSIRKDTDRSIVGSSRVQRQHTVEQVGETRIERIIEGEIVGDVRIERTEDRNQVGVASIFTDKDKRQFGDVRIQRTELRIIEANTRITAPATHIQLGNMRITVETLRDQIGNLSVKRQPVIDQPGHAIIAKEMLADQLGAAWIIRVNDYDNVPRIGIRPQIGGRPSTIRQRPHTDMNVAISQTGRVAERPRVNIVNTRPRARQ